MYTFFIRLAEIDISVTCLYEQTVEFCQDYRIPHLRDDFVEVKIEETDLEMEREKAKREYGDAHVQFSEPYLETLAVYRQIARQVTKYGIILFHGSVVAVDGEAYLFTAPSGTGKSTHTRLWREVFEDRAFMVNDDKPLLKLCEDGTVKAYGTPWAGKHGLSRNVGIPLKGICILARGEQNRICRLSATEAFSTMFQQTYRPANQSEVMKETLQILNHVMGIGIWRLECTISKEAVKLSYEAMSGKELL